MEILSSLVHSKVAKVINPFPGSCYMGSFKSFSFFARVVDCLQHCRHYDVIPAPLEGWNSDPFTLTGRNGYLYGRGVADDKGPILAIACAAADLLARRMLGVDLVLLIEGEEEIGSPNFGETVRKHKDIIGHIDEILIR